MDDWNQRRRDAALPAVQGYATGGRGGLTAQSLNPRVTGQMGALGVVGHAATTGWSAGSHGLWQPAGAGTEFGVPAASRPSSPGGWESTAPDCGCSSAPRSSGWT